jgi:sec-independent protein translocase protein TatA
MFDGLFEGWHIVILLIVVLLLFGSRRLPGAAKSLGESMHIFKRSVSGLHDEDPTNPATATTATTAANPAGQQWNSAPFTGTVPPAAPIAAPVPDPTAQQVADLQRQVAELQRQTTGGSSSGGQASEAQSTQPL